MDNSRRKFLRNTSIAFLGCSAAASLPLVTGCVKNGLSVYTHVKIDEDTCIGCGECLEACYYNAILLPDLTQYYIDTEKCVDCGKCIETCKYEAFFISIPTYRIIEDKCVGCGKCIDECVNEGDCITYTKEEYSVRGKCRPNQCHLQCAYACPEEAITVGEKAEIDPEKCTLCGLCVEPCPRDAINPAKVTIEQEDCNSCGKCLPVCEFDAVNKILPDDYREPRIDMEICVSCGDCLTENACPDFNAIFRDIELAEIHNKQCRECGNCLEICRFESINIEL